MNLNTIYESDIEEASLNWFAGLGYTVLHGPDIAPDTSDAERATYKEVILTRRLRDAVAHLNPEIPAEAQEEAVRKVLHPDSPTLVQNNRSFHQMLVDGVEMEYRQPDGTGRSGQVRLIDFDTPENNDWLVVNQFTVVETSDRRPDIVLFINGLPLAVIELKNPTDEKAIVLTAFRQIQTYKGNNTKGNTQNQVELVKTVRQNISIDWTLKESARAKIRVIVKRILRRHGYPPDKQEKAAETVLEQAEALGKDWAA